MKTKAAEFTISKEKFIKEVRNYLNTEATQFQFEDANKTTNIETLKALLLTAKSLHSTYISDANHYLNLEITPN